MGDELTSLNEAKRSTDWPKWAVLYPAPIFHMECKYSMESIWNPHGMGT
jgi:hypothetical protein